MAHDGYRYQVQILFWIILGWLCVNVDCVYLNKWAVQVKGGEEEANRIAITHGFVNQGQIGSLQGYYLFEHHGVVKRSTDPSHHHHNYLQQEANVLWTEQQKVRRRVKRDFLGHNDEKNAETPGRGTWRPYWNDPLWPSMWYMNGGGLGGHDMNIIGAWEMGYTGKGVVVTILDDGIEHTHEDLIQNYDPDASLDINGGDNDPLPRYDNADENRHGTRCAGEVAAAANNTKCVVGVAYDAKIGGVRMLDGEVLDYVEAQALSLHPQHIDIYSASWGPDDNGRVVDGPARLAKEAFIDGVLKGRGGRGSVYVWASGNGGSQSDSCSCDGYTNSIFTLSVSSASENNVKPWYLEECASTLATTYSSGENYRERKVKTTDLHGKCTDRHTGTSASAPMAAAMCALALQANPRLTWRDMQHVVVLTSDHTPLQDGEWVLNGVSRHVSHKYGFGLMNGQAMVELAERWTSVPEQHICLSDIIIVDQPIEGKGMTLKLDTPACRDTINEVRYLEHVQAKVSLQYSQRGDLRLHLYSPNGTGSTLLPRRQQDMEPGEFRDWPFMSVFYWGEDPQGLWRMEVENTGSGMNTGIFLRWQLILYGTQTAPIDLHDPPTHRPPPGGVDHQYVEEETDSEADSEELGSNGSAEFTEYETGEPGRSDVTEEDEDYIWITRGEEDEETSDCHEQCSNEGCTGPEAYNCLSCLNARLLEAGPCVEMCPAGSFVDMNTGVCEFCPSPCLSCSGPDITSDCTSCFDGYHLLVELGRCELECPQGYFTDHVQMICLQCDKSCASCYEDPDWCSECGDGDELIESTHLCLPRCPPQHYRDLHHECQACEESCGECVGPRPADCVRCVEGLVSQDHVCLPNCSEGYYMAEDASRCFRCSPTCETCSGPSELDCVVCQSPLLLSVTGVCQEQCPYGEYTELDGRSCEACHLVCNTCSGPTNTQCLSCHSDRYFHENQCLPECPVDHFPDTSTYQNALGMTFVYRKCLPCHLTCQSCVGGGANECLSCIHGLFYASGVCRTECYLGEYLDGDQCLLCHNSCRSCMGAHSNQCMSCHEGTYLHEGQCLNKCFTGFYTLANECHQCDPKCFSCVASGPENCLACAEGYLMEDGVCLEEMTVKAMACLPNQYFSEINMNCHDCDESCATCSGGGTHHCTSCNTDRLYHATTHRCMLCCQDMEGLLLQDMECCVCDKLNSSISECREYLIYTYTSPSTTSVPTTAHDTTTTVPSTADHQSTAHTSTPDTSSSPPATTTTVTTTSFTTISTAATTTQSSSDLTHSPHTPGIHQDVTDTSASTTSYVTVPTTPPSSSKASKAWTGVMTIVVCLCLLTTLLFCIVFGLMQAKAHDRLCWGYKYQPVPIHYQNGNSRVVKVVAENGYHDEEEARDERDAKA